jgi:hypothetical protein
MGRKLLFVCAASVTLLLSGTARAQSFVLGFDACPPADVTGTAGEVKTFDIFATLTTNDNTGANGPQGWSISTSISSNATISAISVKGVHVSTIFDDDGDPSTPNVNPFDLDLGGNNPPVGFKIAQLASLPADPTHKGAVSAIVLNNTQFMVLQPTGKQQLAKITVQATVPAAPAVNEVVLKFEDGLKGAGQPVNNVVTFAGSSKTPTLGTCKFNIKEIPPPSKEFILSVIPDASVGTIGSTLEGGNAVLTANVTPGDVLIPCFVTLQTKLLPAGDGPQGWSLSVAHESCMTADTITVKGVHVSTIFDDDGDPSTPLLDPFDLDLGGNNPPAGFKIAQAAVDPNNANQHGAVSAIVLNNTQKMVLHANATDTLLKVIYKIHVVEGVNPDCKVFFQDGLKGAGQPVNNVITYVGSSNTPTTKQGLVLRLNGQKAAVAGAFIRGDANNDGKVNIADAIWVVYQVVPALHGQAAACSDSADANGDNKVDLADAIYLIDWQFRGSGKPPVAPYPLCGADADSTTATCPPSSTLCP